MKTAQTRRRLAQLGLLVLSGLSALAAVAQSQNAPAGGAKAPGNEAGFKEFMDRVHGYIQLHKAVEASLPSLKPTALPEMITAHQQAMARKIRQARPHAKPGDIFSAEARAAFRRTVREEFRGPESHDARTTIRQGEPMKTVQLRVNEPYLEGVPYTTVPPSLLLRFPKVPEEVAYRIVGRDLILLDVNANLVVDKISEIFPQAI
jgi:hypothetical protein